MSFRKILVLSVLYVCGNLQAQVKPYSTPEIEKQVDALMVDMTMEEKLAQIMGTRLEEILEDGKVSLEKCRKHIPNGIGQFCQFAAGQALEPEKMRDLVRQVQHYLMTETRLKIPAIFHEEAITGFATQGATTFPQQIGVGCTWNPELVEKNTHSTAVNMRAVGATLALSPMLDLSRTAHWNRHQESYGEDSYLTSRLGVAFVQGLQGNDFKTGVAATVKHFVGYGTNNDDPKELYEEYLMPHEACMKIAGAKSVMPSYGEYKGVPVAASPQMLDQILRKEVGFDGLVVSDYGAINLLFKKYKVATDSLTAGAMSLNAGMDVELSSPSTFPKLGEALKQGLTTEAKINTAVKRALIMKAKLGLLDKNPIIGKDGDLDLDTAENRKLAYQTASESIVLLENKGVLPLKKSVKKIALVGPNAATVYGLLGDYTYQGMQAFWKQSAFDSNNPKLVTIKEGLESKIGKKVQIAYERGCDWNDDLEIKIDKSGAGDSRLDKLKLLTVKDLEKPNLQRALEISKDSDVIIAVMGENLYLNGEGRNRKGIRLPGEQEAFVQKLLATGKPVVLIMLSGRQEVISNFSDQCAAVIQGWFPGEEAGNAIADILLGTVNPSGKLCVTYPKTEKNVEIDYKNGYPEKELVHYPFGYGLSYTKYEYSDLKMKSNVSNSNETFSVSFTLKNTGKVDGTEITQLYVSPKNAASTLKPIQLKGFERVSLKAGESKKVTFNVSPEQMAQYKNSQWIVESEAYEIKVGASSTDIRLKGEMQLSGKNKLLPKGRQVFFASVTKN
ncbi:glycoside hydrolase family 3 N-terminal domain-containing protein [Flavobacterium sp. 7A]|uniref:glycoside hydrolase family 3 N-terminal domain-containing protein n=1 Tax=Flavobacterium sp. 7A TaxID=2940571 RepID=UPI0022274FCE|nr:glycoside hydrolase family 3 N-terminal domain-containing protein [Flavobacterium sp. 7A]MCW2120306.1 beta-glucosidase [Flavobacterium sp. 7A]